VNSNPSSHQPPQSNKLAVILPSRGLMFSETLEELLGELEDFDYEIFWAHGKSLPDCFNEPLEKVLADPTVFAVLFCEDDMIIPKGILKKMFDQNYPVVALDYPFKDNGDSTMLHDPAGNVIYSGTGFLLCAKAILERMPKPVFRTDTAWDIAIRADDHMFLWPRKLKKIAYGLHDVYFGLMLFSNGIPIHDLNVTAGQRKLVALGKSQVNAGSHAIKELKYVGRDLVIKTLNEENIDRFKVALAKVKAIEVMDRIPDFITYEEGQAVPKFRDQKYQIV
jgi:hypothetical protein